jgi:ribosomal protein S12 methylthiotransferase accessory factor
MGITRVADITGLDTIGVPVVMVCRPNSRSLAVSQGKGVSLATAKASGLMEAVELHHAERISVPLRLGSYEELRRRHRVVDVDALPGVATSVFHPERPLLWIEGHDLLQDEAVWVPYELVHANFTVPYPPGGGCFPMSSNGLASGNHLLEAISHGICELVERDATTLWHLLDEAARRRTRIDLARIDDHDCREVLARCELAGVAVTVWDMTSDVEIPGFYCVITERVENPMRPLGASAGMGCHPDPAIALLRAILEAVQSRLTVIAGSRDDMGRNVYEQAHSGDQRPASRVREEDAVPGRRLHDVPGWSADSLDADVTWELDRLGAIGVSEVVVVDLTDPAFGLPVVRVVIPGLEGPDNLPGYRPGRRARARAAEHG